jgi:hypothetical protein
MTRTLAEILLFTSLAINAALLILLAGVLRMVMNDMAVIRRHDSYSPIFLIRGRLDA